MQRAKEPKFKVTKEERRLEKEWNAKEEELNEGEMRDVRKGVF